MAGSIVLAGIMLKIGGYGFYVFSSLLVTQNFFFSTLILRFVLFSRVVVGIVCFRQKDLKVLIALSRVNHIALRIFGLLLMASSSVVGRIFLMLGHGLLSARLFFLRRVNYTYFSQRSFLYRSGRYKHRQFFFLR